MATGIGMEDLSGGSVKPTLLSYTCGAKATHRREHHPAQPFRLQAMEIVAPSILLALLLVLHSTAAAPSPAMAPAADEHASDVYIVLVSRDDYVDSVDYDIRLLASVVGSAAEAKTTMIYHYSGLGFAASLAPEQAERLRKEGIAIFKDRMYHVEKEEDVRLPRFFEENV